jgi:hypothetical protein
MYIHTNTDQCAGFMKYAVDTMTYENIPNFIKIGSGIQKHGAL